MSDITPASKPDPTELNDYLPPWAHVVPHYSDKVSVVIEVDSHAAYQAWLVELGCLPAADLTFRGGLDQYWIETAYQCIKMDVQAALEGSALDPRVAGKCAQINFTRADQWALVHFKKGKGAFAATKGQEARGHYLRIRGRVPFSG